MFCPNCGTQVENNARFCYNCGNTLAQAAPQQPVSPPPAYQQPVYQQPAPQQQPVYQQTDYHQNYQEKFGINLVYPDGHNDIGDVYFTATEMIFVKKSKAVRLAFGFLGSAIENGSEQLRLNLAEVVEGRKTKIGINPNVYQLTLRRGEVYKLCVNNPAKISYLVQRFG